MQLRLTADCICIHISEASSHYLHVKHVLNSTLGRSYWVNETLINFAIRNENLHQRRSFLISLYQLCTIASKTHNASFLQKLLLASEKPIKLVTKKVLYHSKQTYHKPYNPYYLLNAHEQESLESIRRKYLRLAKTYHPDTIECKNETKLKDFTVKFQQIQEAYATIKAEKSKQFAA